jgi:hypothetical protein
MEDTETPRMRKYGESKTTRIMMATVPHVTSGSGLRKFQADGFLLDRVHLSILKAAAVKGIQNRPDWTDWTDEVTDSSTRILAK